jgi:hypothetical protein
VDLAAELGVESAPQALQAARAADAVVIAVAFVLAAEPVDAGGLARA